jgi:hypothetical protein
MLSVLQKIKPLIINTHNCCPLCIFLSPLLEFHVLFAQNGGKNKYDYRKCSKFKLIVVLGEWRVTQGSSVYEDLDCGFRVLISCAFYHSVKT